MSTLTVIVPVEPRRLRRVRDGLARPVTSPEQVLTDCQDTPGGRHRHPDADNIVGLEHHRRMRDLTHLTLNPTGGSDAA